MELVKLDCEGNLRYSSAERKITQGKIKILMQDEQDNNHIKLHHARKNERSGACANTEEMCLFY
jgi:hypothetical protein